MTYGWRIWESQSKQGSGGVKRFQDVRVVVAISVSRVWSRSGLRGAWRGSAPLALVLSWIQATASSNNCK